MLKTPPAYLGIFRQNHGFLKASDAVRKGIPRYAVYQMCKAGVLVREERGLYRLAEMELPGNSDLVQVCLLVPRAVIALISALSFYGLTTQIPHRVYVTLPRGVKKPHISYPPVEFNWQSEPAYSAGVEELNLDGVPVRIYSREKTIADCFKFRSKIGLDIALEALKAYLHQPGSQIGKLMDYARIDRIDSVMRPYLESLVA